MKNRKLPENRAPSTVSDYFIMKTPQKKVQEGGKKKKDVDEVTNFVFNNNEDLNFKKKKSKEVEEKLEESQKMHSSFILQAKINEELTKLKIWNNVEIPIVAWDSSQVKIFYF
jgi:hypothetical protein